MLEKTYNPADVEERLYDVWEQAGVFAADPSSTAAPYTIMMPPPNVTGNLHMGHALTFTLQDLLIRYHRMTGRDALWQPGTDHAGIATQMVVERQLEKTGVTRHDMGRAAFLDKIWQWKAESGGAITRQLRRLGASPDWARERFTMDDGLSAAVRTIFVKLHKDGLIYRDKRLVNWDPKLHTAISDLEVEQRDVKGHLWHLRYPVEGQPGMTITVATTRPETMLGDTGIAVHPDDERYQGLIGKFVRLPLVDRLIPIVADDYADPTKGSGAVKITPAHDFNDFEVGRRHGLGLINIFDRDAKIAAGAQSLFRFEDNHAKTDTSAGLHHLPERFQGLDRFAARAHVVAEFEALGLLDKIDDNPMTVPYGDRSGVVIEPWLTDQWFVNVAPLATRAVEAVETGKTVFVPRSWENTFYDWMRNIQPWCISRQLWWGHQIPAWFGPDGQPFVALTEAEAMAEAATHYGVATALVRDPDVLDTWFSSGLWPFSTLGWPEQTEALKRYYPTDVLVTGFDIIFFWVARMMMMGLYAMDEVPFKTVYIHALVRDEKGQKMSKSKGNVIDPLDLIATYGTDALRFTLTAMAAQGRDIKMAEGRVAGYRNFATKLWNATRFCQMNECMPVAGFNPATVETTLARWIIAKTAETAGATRAALEAYRFNDAAAVLYQFTWGIFCDVFLEFAKPVFAGDDPKAGAEIRATVAWVLDNILILLHPIMPFITEELWAAQGDGRGLLIAQQWPSYAGLDSPEARAEMDWVVEFIALIRSIRQEIAVPAAPLAVVVEGAGAETLGRLEAHRGLIAKIARLSAITAVTPVTPGEPVMGAAARLLLGEATLILPLDGVIDIAAEKARLSKEISKLVGDIGKITGKLANHAFVAKAPPEVIDEQRERLAEAESARVKLSEALGRLG